MLAGKNDNVPHVALPIKLMLCAKSFWNLCANDVAQRQCLGSHGLFYSDLQNPWF